MPSESDSRIMYNSSWRRISCLKANLGQVRVGPSQFQRKTRVKRPRKLGALWKAQKFRKQPWSAEDCALRPAAQSGRSNLEASTSSYSVPTIVRVRQCPACLYWARTLRSRTTHERALQPGTSRFKHLICSGLFIELRHILSNCGTRWTATTMSLHRGGTAAASSISPPLHSLATSHFPRLHAPMTSPYPLYPSLSTHRRLSFPLLSYRRTIELVSFPTCMPLT